MKHSLKILIGGGSGFVGSVLRSHLTKRGHVVSNISRNPTGGDVSWSDIERNGLPQCDAVVQLSGCNILEKRWTPSRKQEILSSRIDPTQLLSRKILEMNNPPKVFVSASAIGYYPFSNTEVYDETYSGGPSNTFPSEVCSKWEDASKTLEGKIRRVIVRIGVVLGQGGALTEMKLPFGLAYVGTIGDGSQYFPWIHVDDLAELFVYAIENDQVHGVLNGVSTSITNAQFAQALREVYNRPALYIPESVVNLMFGESAMMLTRGMNVVPRITEEQWGFRFKFKDVKEALGNIE